MYITGSDRSRCPSGKGGSFWLEGIQSVGRYSFSVSYHPSTPKKRNRVEFVLKMPVSSGGDHSCNHPAHHKFCSSLKSEALSRCFSERIRISNMEAFEV